MVNIWLTLLTLTVAFASEFPAYQLTQEVRLKDKLTAALELTDPGAGPFGPSLPHLSFSAYYETDFILHVHITDAEAERWDPDNYPIRAQANQPVYDLQLQQSPFSFKVLRGGDAIFATQGVDGAPALYFADRYLELSTALPSNPNIYGLGDRVTSFRLDTDETRYTIWALAQDCIYDTGKERGRNMYGHHPFYMELRNGLAHGVYFHNINAMDAVFSQGRLAFKTVGGLLDLYFFMGPTPQAVIQQYLSVIGSPMLPPFWALGYHQCRWGYSTLGDMQAVVSGYDDNDLPLDVLWSDIDYMEVYKDFTLDTIRYPYYDFETFLAEFHAAGRRYVPIIDAGVKVEAGYFGYEEGKAMDIFIKRRADSTEDFEGQVWPGKSVFVDWFHPKAQTYWSNMLDRLHDQVPFDGIWVDMNEASSFCDGECPGFYSTPEQHLDLPYVPGNHSLEDQLLPLLAQQYGGPMHTIFNTHGTFGTMETEATYRFLAEKFQERPFVLSRSSRAGHGRWGFHWLGDNWSQWEQMRESIAGVFNFQLFGVGLVGADVCGFHLNTTVELCSRWLQLGGFYPFMRNHNDLGWVGQELYALGADVMRRGKQAVHLRYSLSTYFYTQLHFFSNSASKSSAPLFRPLLFDFPELQTTYNNEEQVMVGPALLFNPVLYEGAVEVAALVPASEVWYDYFTGKRLGSEALQVFAADLDHISLLLRGGYAIPCQDSTNATTIVQMRNRPINFKIALNSQGSSFGSLIIDDGLSLRTLEEAAYSEYQIGANCTEQRCLVSVRQVVYGYQGDYGMIGRIEVYGVKGVTEVRTKGKSLHFEWEEEVLRVPVMLPLHRIQTVELRFT